MARRLDRPTIERMRRSLAMSGQLPTDEVRWLLDEAEGLVRDRDRLEEITAQLRGPWRDVRAALNELGRLVGG